MAVAGGETGRDSLGVIIPGSNGLEVPGKGGSPVSGSTTMAGNSGNSLTTGAVAVRLKTDKLLPQGGAEAVELTKARGEAEAAGPRKVDMNDAARKLKTFAKFAVLFADVFGTMLKPRPRFRRTEKTKQEMQS